MPKKPKAGDQITVAFADINYPADAIPFDVNETFTLALTKDKNFQWYEFKGEMDAEQIYPYIKVSESPDGTETVVAFYVRQGPYGAVGTKESMAFSGTGHSPIENVMSRLNMDGTREYYGGTATLT